MNTPQQWADIIRKEIHDPDLRRHIARIVWFECATEAMTQEEVVGWKNFTEEYTDFTDYRIYSKREMIDGLIAIGFSEEWAVDRTQNHKER